MHVWRHEYIRKSIDTPTEMLQVRGNYLVTIDNVIEVDTDTIAESQMETQASTR